MFVPNSVIHDLYFSVFNDESKEALGGRATPPRAHVSREDQDQHYGIGHLKQLLAEDPRTNELDIQVEKSGTTIILRGEVCQEERRAAVEAIARECFPTSRIENQIRVQEFSRPRRRRKSGDQNRGSRRCSL